ncbi:hypothetical protein [Bacillus sp. NPDC094106]|uniref:hypothetical protein n=1 Tax=Bacillus sp. NPDC094106 TaxID=3363949 RepID=UPI003817CCF0
MTGKGYLANPFCFKCYEDRLIASGSIDLRNNLKTNDLGNGYEKISPIDSNRKWQK